MHLSTLITLLPALAWAQFDSRRWPKSDPFIQTPSNEPWLILYGGTDAEARYTMQPDGDFTVRYPRTTSRPFSSGTGGHDCPIGGTRCYLVWQNDGSLSVVIDNVKVWSTGTEGRGEFLRLNTWENIGIEDGTGTTIYGPFTGCGPDHCDIGQGLN